MKGVTDSVIGGRQQWGAMQGRARARASGKTGSSTSFLFAAPLSCMDIHHRDCLASVRSGGRPGFSSNWWGIAATATVGALKSIYIGSVVDGLVGRR